MAGPPNPYCLHLGTVLGPPSFDVSNKSIDQLPLGHSAVAKGGRRHVEQGEKKSLHKYSVCSEPEVTLTLTLELVTSHLECGLPYQSPKQERALD